MRNRNNRWILILLAVFGFSFLSAGSLNNEQDPASDKIIVYKYEMTEQIAPAIWRITKKSFEEAKKMGADFILIHMNTYGGLLDAADSIRTMILNSPIPVLVFIDNNAASAGALIAIACDSIYMRPGGSIGAATVVDQTGKPVPDKYQSFMRSIMRATAEAHGKDTIIKGNDTIIKWHRDPKIAEAMVDPSIFIEGIVDTGKVLTLTTDEAIKYGFCEGEANNIQEVMKIAGIGNYEIKQYEITALDRIISFLLNPILRGLLIMLIIGGIYFELQSPGVGFPLAAAITAAVLYFAPLYLEGLAQNWELLIFIAGLILLIVEIFAIPGFGVAGISGIILMVGGLTLAMVDNIVFDFNFSVAFAAVVKSFFIVVVSIFLGLVLSIWLGGKLFASRKIFAGLSLDRDMKSEEGFIGVESKPRELIGRTGVADTILRPAGKVIIDNEIYDAKAEYGFISKGEKVKVVRYETGQIYVIKIEELNQDK
jgi:membrane-bound serine protease (ClpP class)